MKDFRMDAYDGMNFFGGLVFFAPVALLVRTQAGVGEGQFFLLQVLLSAVIVLGELPTGMLTDRFGYRRSLILSQLLLLLARGALLAAFLLRSLPLFVLEAVIEGVSACLSSGTNSAYLYALCGEEDYLPRTTHAANFGTAGFLLSTASYAAIYQYFSLKGLLVATVLSGAGEEKSSSSSSSSAGEEVSVPQDSTFRPDQRKVMVSSVTIRLGSSNFLPPRLTAVMPSTRKASGDGSKPWRVISPVISSHKSARKSSGSPAPDLLSRALRTTLSGFSRS